MTEVPTTPEALAKVKDALVNSDMAKALISKDGNASILLVSLKEGLDSRPVPYFTLTYDAKQAPDSTALAAIAAITGKELSPVLESTEYDQNQWDSNPKQVAFSVTTKIGFEPQALKNALNAWIRDSGRADWQVNFVGEKVSFVVTMNSNESPVKTRSKIESFIAKAGELRQSMSPSVVIPLL